VESTGPQAVNTFLDLKMSDQARWKATVYVGGLAPMITAANLEAAFLPFGEIADVSIPYVLRAQNHQNTC